MEREVEEGKGKAVNSERERTRESAVAEERVGAAAPAGRQAVLVCLF